MVGTGVGLSRYKNGDAYVAVVAEVSVNTKSGVIRPLKLWSATDAGRAVNPDGVLNQIDGGMAQADELDPAGGRPLGQRHHESGRLRRLPDPGLRHDARPCIRW